MLQFCCPPLPAHALTPRFRWDCALSGEQATVSSPPRPASKEPAMREGFPHPPTHLLLLQVRSIQEAQQEFKKTARQVQRSRSAASLPGTAETELLRQQMEADRRERALAEPAKPSVAQPLPGQGARVATAKDAGINCDCC